MIRRLVFALALMCGAGAHPALAQDHAEWVTLGTSGGPSAQVERSQIANALVVGGAVYVFDAGNGVRRQMAKAGVPERSLRALFLSHHHPDHNSDTGSLIVNHWLMGGGKVLPIVGPEGTRTLVAGLVAANEPTVLASFPTIGPAKAPLASTVKASDLPLDMTEPRLVYEDANIRVHAITVNHYVLAPSVPTKLMPQAVAYRVEAGGKTWVYTGDTGPSAGLEKLARGADILVTEVVDLHAIDGQLAKVPGMPEAVRQNLVEGMRVNHLPAEEIGKLAKAAGVKRIVLTHFVPSPEAIADPMEMVRAIHRHFDGPVTIASDLERF